MLLVSLRDLHNFLKNHFWSMFVMCKLAEALAEVQSIGFIAYSATEKSVRVVPWGLWT